MTMFMALFIGMAGLGGSMANLTVNVSPSDATVQLDGKRIAAGKAVSVSLGKHTVKVSRKGYNSLTKSVTVKPGKGLNLKLSLKKSVAGRLPAGKPNKPQARRPKPRAKPKPRGRAGSHRPVKPIAKPRAKPAAKPNGKGGTLTGARKPKPRGRAVDVDIPRTKKPVRKPRRATPAAKPRRADNRRDVRPPERRRRPPRGALDTRRDKGTNNGGGSVRGRTNSGGRGSLKPLAVVSFLVGGAAIAGGVITGQMADDRAEDFNNSRLRDKKLDYKREAEDLSTGSNVLYGVGATGIALGALLWSMDSAYRAEVAPMPGGGAYVGIGGSF